MRGLPTIKALAILFLGATMVASCEAIEDMLEFEYEDQVSFSVPATTLNVIPVINTPPVQSNAQQSFENEGTKAEYVKTAYLTDLTLTIESPENQTFSFLKGIEIFINAEGQERTLIASKGNITEQATNVIKLDTQSSVNLKPYLSGDSYAIEVKAITDETTNQRIDIKSEMKYSVTADVF